LTKRAATAYAPEVVEREEVAMKVQLRSILRLDAAVR
jgi:hypothetical protein